MPLLNQRASGRVFARPENSDHKFSDWTFFQTSPEWAAQVRAACGRLSISDMEAHELTHEQPLDRVAGEPLLPAIARRLIDLVVAGAMIVLLSPLLIAVAIAIRLDSRGPALFRQRRVGYGEREFTIFKFRSMRSDADPGGHRDYVTALIKGKAGQRRAKRTSTSSPSTTGSPRSAAGSGAGASTSCRSSST